MDRPNDRREQDDDFTLADVLAGRSRRSGGPPVDGGQDRPELRLAWTTLRRFLPVLPVVVLGLWLLTGFYIVGPDEQAVVLRLGREVDKRGPGLHYHPPRPVHQVEKVNVEAIRRLEVGFRTTAGQVRRVPDEALMLTGDENIVEAQVIVQYRVRDPSQFLFRVRDPEEAVRSTTEVALRSMIGGTTIDDALTVGRGQVQDDTRVFLQRLLDVYEAGIAVTDVKLQVVDPPDEVKDAFHEVVRAREDRERLINQSEAYREDILPKARGEAEQILRAAEAYREQRVIQSQGDTARFVAVLEQYLRAPEVTRERLYLESLERILPRLEKVIVDETAPGVLPVLPLRPTGGGGSDAARTVAPAPTQAAATPTVPTAGTTGAARTNAPPTPAAGAARPVGSTQTTPTGRP